MDVTVLDAAGKQSASLPRHCGSQSSCTSLHTAVWQSRPDLVADLLETGVQIDAQDQESSWTALHRALYWGSFSCAAVLLGSNAQLMVPDCQGRTPLDLVSAELKGFLEHESAGLVSSWGNGANYQLGTGATGLQSGPVRLDGLRKELVVQIAAAKFHSAAVTKDGRVFTWGFGRGGRLGHPEFDVHSGESAIIVPRAITGLGRRQVSMVAVAKHHTAVVTTSCELFTWGSNRDGRLGYAAIDTQPTPRKVISLKLRVVSVAVANKHTAILTDAGAIYSWGANDQGQLGYGTSDSASNALPRQVEAMKGKRLVALAAAKRHMVVMSSDGDIYTWGHRAVTPRRVQLAGARDVQRAGNGGDIAFHKGQSEISRPHAVAIAAGAAHSCCLTRLGVVLAWRSWDPALAVQEVSGSLTGKRVVSIAAGKYRTAAVTDEGDIYMWEGLSKQHPHCNNAKGANLPPRPDKAARRKLLMSETIAPERIPGIKRVTKACVGEKHSLALQCWSHAPKQLRLPLLAEAAALPSLSRAHTRGLDDDAEELLAISQEDAEYTAAADRAAGSSHATASSTVRAAESEGQTWLGRDFWHGLEAAHQKIQDAAVRERASDLFEQEAQSSVPSLQRLCERSLAEHDVEPRTCLQIMEYADACGAEVLKQYCLAVALSNMDTVLLEARGVLEGIAPHLLEEMEAVQKAQFEPACPIASNSQGPDSCQQLLTRRPTASQGIDADDVSEEPSSRRSSLVGQALEPSGSSAVPDMFQERSFCSPEDTQQAAAAGRAIRNLKKKLQQIDALQARQQDNQLDQQQQAKLAQRAEIVAMLVALQLGCSLEDAQKAAQPVKHLSSITSSDLLHRSSSNTSLDSSSSKRKPRTGKHNKPTSQPSRLSMTASTQDTAQLDTHGPDHMSSATDTHHTQPNLGNVSGQPDPNQKFMSAAASAQSTAAAEAVSPMPSAWQRPGNSSAAGFTISGFSTPQSQKTAAAAWPSPSGGSLMASDQGGHASAASPSPSGAASRAKPPRKGGLSMFLSGGLEPAAAPSPPPLPAPTMPPPAAEFSWGGASLGRATSTTSLRDIQSQEAASIPKPEMRSTPSRTPSLLSGNRPLLPKADNKGKNRQSSEPAAEPSWNQVPLEALVRKSSPIAVNPKQQQEQEQPPSEPQGPAWGGALLGPSPPAEGLLQSGMPSLRDIQAQQQQVRESCSRSFGAAGSSPGSAGRDGFSSYLQWRAGSGGQAAGTSPGALFPAGSSPHTRKTYAPSPQPNSKWYIQEERPVIALSDIQSEEYTRELQAQQEAADHQAAADKAAAAAAAKKAARKQQRQRKQAKLRAAADAEQNAVTPNGHPADTGSSTVSGAALPAAQPSDSVDSALQSVAATAAAVGMKPALPAGMPDLVAANASRASATKPARRANPRGGGSGRTRRDGSASNSVMEDDRSGQRQSAAKAPRQRQHAAANPGDKPRILEVRRPKQQNAQPA